MLSNVWHVTPIRHSETSRQSYGSAGRVTGDRYAPMDGRTAQQLKTTRYRKRRSSKEALQAESSSIELDVDVGQADPSDNQPINTVERTEGAARRRFVRSAFLGVGRRCPRVRTSLTPGYDGPRCGTPCLEALAVTDRTCRSVPPQESELCPNRSSLPSRLPARWYDRPGTERF